MDATPQLTVKPPGRPAKDVLNRKEAAQLLGELLRRPIAPKTMANWAANKNALAGPPFTRVGWSTVQYRRVDLEEWASRQRVEIR